MALHTSRNFGTFYARLMASLGLVALACGPGGGETEGATEGASSTGGGSSGAATTSGATTGGATSSTGGGSQGGSSGGGSDTGEGSSGGGSSGGGGSTGASTGEASGTGGTGTGEGTSTSTSSTSGGDTGEFTCPPPPPTLTQQYICFAEPIGGCAACDEACTIDKANTIVTGDPLCFWTEMVIQCGPDPMPDAPGQCCYFVAYGGGMACAGRPFVVADEARTAAPARRGDWAGEARPSLAGLSEGTRAALAELWAADAAMEHASVASFARFALQLLAVGAPAALVEGTQRALADEVAHARACYALAGAYAGRPIGPGPLDMSDALGGADLASLVEATIVEGCVGETLAALVAEAAAQQARDPAVRAALRKIAEDEGRHAQLAWRFVQWALGRSPAVHEAARAAFAAAVRAPVPARPWPEGADAASMRAHGRLAPEEQAALCRDALAGVVEPAAAALLGSVAAAA